MKRLSIILFMLISTQLYAPRGLAEISIIETTSINPYEKIWSAVKWVETQDRDMINYQEGAFGRGQIRQCKLDEYNQKTVNHYTLQDCMKEPVSRKVFMWHMMEYNDTDLAIRRWNGSGPATYEYLRKVREQYD